MSTACFLLTCLAIVLINTGIAAIISRMAFNQGYREGWDDHSRLDDGSMSGFEGIEAMEEEDYF
jgi:hypothetical protein